MPLPGATGAGGVAGSGTAVAVGAARPAQDMNVARSAERDLAAVRLDGQVWPAARRREILDQMRQHYRETSADYRAKVIRSFRTLQPFLLSAASNARVRDLKTAAIPLSETRRHLFTGSRKSPYALHRFDSDPERRFAAMIDSDFERSVIHWLKPSPGQFSIEYHSGKSYKPDFVVETDTEKLIVEVKSVAEMDDPIVRDKARAASEWVKHANGLAQEGTGRPWAYLLVPESALTESATMAGLRSSYGDVLTCLAHE